MELLTKEQIELLDAQQAAKHLKLIEKSYKLDKPIQDYLTVELWDQLDDIVNNLLWVEDHLDKIKQIAHLDSIRYTKGTETE